MSNQKQNSQRKPTLVIHLVAGGAAGLCEAMACHPLDTIKVRMQLSKRAKMPGVKPRGFIATGAQIIKRETPLGLYKGLGAVVTGIVPKMAIRFSSFEMYKSWLADDTGKLTGLAGLAAGTTEAIAVVCPMEVIKIRLQAQHHSMADPLDIPKYRNAAHAAYTVIKEEGFGALYRGVGLTALRQATNQAVNFTAYQEMKKWAKTYQPQYLELPAWQHLLLGGISGAFGPMSNAPIDTIKTRIQRAPNPEGLRGWTRFMAVSKDLFKNEGISALYKGLTPRILRVAPGQAVTFMVYEKVKNWIESLKERKIEDVVTAYDS
ncbi:Succinate/fumarate mitochondrial transporter [Neolecta irregularis DAH-3]|uniref:Succinate/fumarate mitochondrial transporter n=1 Tax=Neolecta irregularis (strain DAH-3) TaxID=1198029 RepID=A0A1U7LIT8_NEOID|nr:Succinate/fumarate mitochondrial transporter [Neolecta irregularis DAH-3]|eukprot:OLL22462.1 Succinate/fumarate mitochondrial transporter [Neolecta irregularis DAH-3]